MFIEKRHVNSELQAPILLTELVNTYMNDSVSTNCPLSVCFAQHLKSQLLKAQVCLINKLKNTTIFVISVQSQRHLHSPDILGMVNFVLGCSKEDRLDLLRHNFSLKEYIFIKDNTCSLKKKVLIIARWNCHHPGMIYFFKCAFEGHPIICS